MDGSQLRRIFIKFNYTLYKFNIWKPHNKIPNYYNFIEKYKSYREKTSGL